MILVRQPTKVASIESIDQLHPPNRPPPMPRSPANPSPGTTRSLDLGQGVSLDLQYIPPGRFWMGSRDGNPEERPRHQVEILQGFWLARTPTTLAQFQRFRPEHKNNFPNFPDDPRHPVIHVSWTDASAFCQWLTDDFLLRHQEWKTLRAQLPTEAQWEYACRGPDGNPLVESEYWSGDGEAALNKIGWFCGNSAERLQLVGQKPANAWRLCDMHGLVWEWCQEEWNDRPYFSRPEIFAAPANQVASSEWNYPRVGRGGSWIDGAASCRSASKGGHGSACGNWRFGFRVASVARSVRR